MLVRGMLSLFSMMLVHTSTLYSLVMKLSMIFFNVDGFIWPCVIVTRVRGASCWIRAVNRWIEVIWLGFKGLKIFKVFGFYLWDDVFCVVVVDDSRLDLFWEKVGELGIFVSIHIGDFKVFWFSFMLDNECYEEFCYYLSWFFYD